MSPVSEDLIEILLPWSESERYSYTGLAEAFAVSPKESTCSVAKINVQDENGREVNGFTAEGTTVSVDVSKQGIQKVFVQAETMGLVKSEPVAMRVDVCHSPTTHLESSKAEISEFMSLNEGSGTKIIAKEQWSTFLVTEKCFSCGLPEFSIVDEDGTQVKELVKLGAKDELLIDTSKPVRFKGYLQASYSKQNKLCYGINSKPTRLPLSVEVCGLEEIKEVSTKALQVDLKIGESPSKIFKRS